jgi:hypothetical protein
MEKSPTNTSQDIQAYETKVSAQQITTFLQENANAIDNSVMTVIQKNHSFLERYVTQRGLVKLVDEIKRKQVKNVGQFYELIYKIECDGKLQAAAEFVKTRSDKLKLEFQDQFRKFTEAKLVEINKDINSTREKCSQEIIKAFIDLDQYKDIPFLYDQNLASVQNQASMNFDTLNSHMTKFTNVVTDEAKKYELKL